MNRTARAGFTALLSGLLVLSGFGFPAQAEESASASTATPSPQPKVVAKVAPQPAAADPMTVSLNYTEAYPGTDVVLTATFAPAQPDGGTVYVDVNGKTKSAKVANNKAKIALPALAIGKHPIVARFQAAGQTTDSETAKSSVSIVSGRRVKFGVNSGTNAVFAGGEKFWIRGQVRNAANNPVAHQKVTLYYAYSGKKRKTLAHVTSNASGTFFYAVRPSRTTYFRATHGSLESAKVKATKTTAARTLQSREGELDYLLGAATDGVKTRDSLTYREYAGGTLLSNGSHTWLVRGRILSEYMRRSGFNGKLGVPHGDEKCRLKEGACLQRFADGSVYTNAHAKDRTTSAVATASAADLVATALSQVGYREPHPRKSKYNTWMHRTGVADAWCGYFAAWSSVASGHGSAVIKAKTFDGMVAAEKKRNRTTKKPAIGRLAYIDYFRNGKPTHVGIVTKYTAKSVWTVEGNVSAGGGSQQPRGVHIVKRSRARVVTYANPRW